MFKTCIGVDLGSKNTRLALRTGVFTEPTLVSMAACEREARSIGKCAEFAEYGRVAPIKNGCCVNSKLLAALLGVDRFLLGFLVVHGFLFRAY